MPESVPASNTSLLDARLSAMALPGLSGITDVRMNAANASLDTSPASPFFVFSNVRAVSSTTTLNDLLRVRYPVTKTSLNLSSSSVEVFKNIGVYSEERALFMKDASTLAPMKYGTTATAYKSGVHYSFTGVNGTKPFVLDMQAGQVLGLDFPYLSTPCYVALTRSSTAPTAAQYTGLMASGFYASGLAVLSPGKYYLWLKPQAGASASVRFSYHNENAGTLTRAV